MLAESFNIHMTLSPIFAEFSDFLKVRKSEKDAVAKVFAIHSHTLPYTPIHSHTLPYTPIYSRTLPYTPIHSRTLHPVHYRSILTPTTSYHQHTTTNIHQDTMTMAAAASFPAATLTAPNNTVPVSMSARCTTSRSQSAART